MSNLAYSPKIEQDYTYAKTPKLRVIKKRKKSYLQAKTMVVISVVLGAMIVNSYAVITELTHKKDRLQNDISKLNNEQVSLNARKSTVLGLSNVEQYVRENLNMSKISKQQIEYVELAKPDVITISSGPIKSNIDTMFSKIKDISIGILEYIR